MAISLVASTSAAGLTGGTTPAVDTTGASLLVLCVVHGTTLTSLTDSKGNTWLPLTARVVSTTTERLYYCFGPVVGSGHTFSLVATNGALVAYGFAGTSSYHSESGTTASAFPASPRASGSLTPSVDGALIVSAMGFTDVATDSITPVGFTQTTVPFVGGASLGESAAWQVQAVAAPINPTWAWTPATAHGRLAIASAVFLPPPPPPITKVQATPLATADAQTSVAMTFATPPALGAGIVVGVLSNYVGASNAGLPAGACTDNQGNTYVRATHYGIGPGPASFSIYYCATTTATGAPFTITIAPGVGAKDFVAIALEVNATALIVHQTPYGNAGIGANPNAIVSGAGAGSPPLFGFATVSYAVTQTSLTVAPVETEADFAIPWVEEGKVLTVGPYIAGGFASRSIPVPSGLGSVSAEWFATASGWYANGIVVFRGTPLAAPPTLSGISPPDGMPGTIVAVTLSGGNFVIGGTTVAVSGTGVAVSAVSVSGSSSLTATFTIDPWATDGDRDVTVTTIGGTSSPVTFTVLAAGPPTLSGISPPAGTQGTIVAVTLSGTNFVIGGTTVAVSGTGIAVSAVSVSGSSSLTAVFTIDSGATVGDRDVTVTTVGGTSGPVPFTVLAPSPAPTLAGISPASGVQGANVVVTLTGTGFVPGATTVAVSGDGIAVLATLVVAVSGTSVTATFVINAAAALGPHTVTVTTVTGTSGPLTFTVLPASGPPTLIGIAPASGLAGTPVAVLLTGTAFVAGATTVAVSGTGVVVSGVAVGTAAALSAIFTIAPGATLGARTVTVTTPLGTSGPLTFTVLAAMTPGVPPAPGVASLYQSRSAVCRSGVALSSNTTRHLHIWLHGSHNEEVTCDLMDTTGITITKSLSGGLSEFAFAIRRIVPTLATPVTVDLGRVLIWGGTIASRRSAFLDDVALVHHDVAAVDWRWLLDRWRLVSGTFQDVPVNELVARLLRDFVDPASGFTTGDIAMALGSIPMIEFSDVTVSDALTRIAQATTATLYGAGANWRIRPDKAVDVGVQWADAPISLTQTGPLPTCYEHLTYQRDLSQVRNDIRILAGGAKVAIPTPAGSTELTVTNGLLYDPAGGVVRCRGIDISYTTVIPSTLSGILYGCTGITQDLAAGDEVQPMITTTDPASQTAIAAALGDGQSGRIVVSRENRQLSWSEATGAAGGELAQFAQPPIAFEYGLTTPAARLVDVGKLVDAYIELPGVDAAHPADIIDGIFRVQELTFTSITSPALAGPDPRLRVVLSASPARPRSWYDFVKQEPDRKAR